MPSDLSEPLVSQGCIGEKQKLQARQFLQSPQSRTLDLCVSDREQAKSGERREIFQTCVVQLSVVKIKETESGHACEVPQLAACDARFAQVKCFDPAKILEVLDPLICDTDVHETKHLQIVQRPNLGIKVRRQCYTLQYGLMPPNPDLSESSIAKRALMILKTL
jgi:hypothetical protein